jgi:replication-associated recombination protein RarA
MDNLFGPTQAQAELTFPLTLAERYRPRNIAEFVGLDKAKKMFSKLAVNPSESSWLLTGPSGTGKTSMALALAAMIPAELHHVPSQNCNLETIERVRRTCQYVPAAGYKAHLVLVDEADRMSDAAQIALLSKLDGTDKAPNTIWVFTCNSTERLEKRFLSRHFVVDFSSYGMAKEAAALLASIWSKECTDASAPAPNFARIVKDANNNIRESLMKLEMELMLV